MTDARWAEVEADVRSACRHYGMAVRIFDAGGFGDPDVADLDLDDLGAYRNRGALRQAMLFAGISLERALERILEMLGEDRSPNSSPRGGRAEEVAPSLDMPGLRRHAVLTPGIEDDVNEARLFGRRALRRRDHPDPGQAARSIEAARRLSLGLPVRIADFRDSVDPPGLGHAPRA